MLCALFAPLPHYTTSDNLGAGPLSITICSEKEEWKAFVVEKHWDDSTFLVRVCVKL